MLIQSLVTTQPGYKGKKVAVVFDLISYQFTSFFASGCYCNTKLKQFPGHYCSKAIVIFQMLSTWPECVENFRDYSDIIKKWIIWVRVPCTMWVLGQETSSMIHLFLKALKLCRQSQQPQWSLLKSTQPWVFGNWEWITKGFLLKFSSNSPVPGLFSIKSSR